MEGYTAVLCGDAVRPGLGGREAQQDGGSCQISFWRSSVVKSLVFLVLFRFIIDMLCRRLRISCKRIASLFGEIILFGGISMTGFCWVVCICNPVFI
jgi:hypothetical protein